MCCLREPQFKTYSYLHIFLVLAPAQMFCVLAQVPNEGTTGDLPPRG